MIHECRRALFNCDTLGSNKWPLEKGEDDQTVESVNKVTASLEMSISDMETDDEVCNMQFLLLLCVCHAVHNIK
jgi:hypothetical protein